MSAWAAAPVRMRQQYARGGAPATARMRRRYMRGGGGASEEEKRSLRVWSDVFAAGGGGAKYSARMDGAD